MSDMSERVAQLERQMSEQIVASAALTKAVTDLTTVLTSGKLAIKILFSLAAIGASGVTFIYWLATHVSFNGH